jgi:hypothetical protein
MTSRAALDLRSRGPGPALLLGTVTGGLGLLVAIAAGRDAERFLTFGLEVAIPLATGLAATGALAGDRCLELQATGLGALPRLAAVRLAGLLAGTALSAAALQALAAARGVDPLPRDTVLASQAVWLVPALFLLALGFGLSLALHGATVAATLLGSLWAAQVLFAKLILALGDAAARLFLFPTSWAPEAGWWAESRALVALLAAGLLAAAGLATRRVGLALELDGGG